MRKDRDMARMTMPLTTEANTATLRPRSSGLGIAVEGKSWATFNIDLISRSLEKDCHCSVAATKILITIIITGFI